MARDSAGLQALLPARSALSGLLACTGSLELLAAAAQGLWREAARLLDAARLSGLPLQEAAASRSAAVACLSAGSSVCHTLLAQDDGACEGRRWPEQRPAGVEVAWVSRGGAKRAAQLQLRRVFRLEEQQCKRTVLPLTLLLARRPCSVPLQRCLDLSSPDSAAWAALAALPSLLGAAESSPAQLAAACDCVAQLVQLAPTWQPRAPLAEVRGSGAVGKPAL